MDLTMLSSTLQLKSWPHELSTVTVAGQGQEVGHGAGVEPQEWVWDLLWVPCGWLQQWGREQWDQRWQRHLPIWLVVQHLQ